MGEEVILPFPARIEPVREIRSTVIVTSLGVLRTKGYFDQYAASLPADVRDVIVHSVAGAWIPIEHALVHYAACDAIGIPPDEIAAIGRAVFDKVGGTLLGTMFKMAREVGASPWTVLPHLQRFWDRAYRGGALCITKTGPKEARGEVQQARICDSVYYRNALRGLLGGVLELFCQKAYVTITRDRRPAGMTVRMQWA